MKTEINYTCPFSGQKTNATTVKIIAVLISLIIFLSFLFKTYLFPAFLVLDFFSRAFLNGRGSVLKIIAKYLTNVSTLKNKLIDAAPKIFAAKIGFAFSVVIFITQFFSWENCQLVASTILFVCAILEGVFEICLGCYFYTLYLKLKKIVAKN